MAQTSDRKKEIEMAKERKKERKKEKRKKERTKTRVDFDMKKRERNLDFKQETKK